MILYGDTSALLKLYVGEKGSTETLLETTTADQVATSALTRVELEASLYAAVKTGRVAAADLPEIMARLNRDWNGLLVVPIVSALLTEATVLTWRHGLRAGDAVHLASAMRVEQLAGEPITLAVYDEKLWNASVQQGIAAWPRDLAPFR